MDTAAWYRWFADNEARGSSPQYERLANAIADSEELLAWLSRFPNAKRQPNLLFAAVRFLGGPTDSVEDFTEYVRTNSKQLEASITARSTQTNEVARCAAFLPALAEIDGDVALIEVGTSAGLCLFPDRYAYSFDGHEIGHSELVIGVDAAGTVATPTHLPSVIWRAGLDLNPLDVADDDDLAWLHACIWPEHDERRRRLELAAAIVTRDPPSITRGDMRVATLALIDSAPAKCTKVVFHSAALGYVDKAGRAEFAATMRHHVGQRNDLVWLSNENPSVVPDVEAPRTNVEHPVGAPFHLVRNGVELLALADPHGRWLRWNPRAEVFLSGGGGDARTYGRSVY